MTEGVDEVARELARAAEKKADLVTATSGLELKEARRDIERLDASFKEFRGENTRKWDDFASDQRKQFYAIIALLVSIGLYLFCRSMGWVH